MAPSSSHPSALPHLADRELETARLRLRPWREADLEPFARLNADLRVMEFMPSVLSREQSDALAQRIRLHFKEHSFGLWAVEQKARPGFMGFVGLSVPNFEAAFTPCVEVGWRLARAQWGAGFATEAASAALTHAFGALGLDEIVSFTAHANTRSTRVMEKLGMTRNPDEDFDHPALAVDHPLRPHVLYRIASSATGTQRGGA